MAPSLVSDAAPASDPLARRAPVRRAPRSRQPASARTRDDTAAASGLRAQFPSQLRQLRVLFPDWSDEDLLFVLGDAGGEVEAAAGLIGDGFATQFSSVKTHHPKKEPRREHPAPSSSPASASVARAGRPVSAAAGRGGGRAGRGGRSPAPVGKTNGHADSSAAAAPASTASAPAPKPTGPSWADRIKESQAHKAAAVAAARASRAAAQEPPKTEDVPQVPPTEDAFPPVNEMVPASSSAAAPVASGEPVAKPAMSWAQILSHPKPAPASATAAPEPTEEAAEETQKEEPAETTETTEAEEAAAEAPEPEAAPAPEEKEEEQAPAPEETATEVVPEPEPEAAEPVSEAEPAPETAHEEPAKQPSPAPIPAPALAPTLAPAPAPAPVAPAPAPIKIPTTRKQAQPLVIPGGPASLESLGVQFGSLGVESEPAPVPAQNAATPAPAPAEQSAPAEAPRAQVPAGAASLPPNPLTGAPAMPTTAMPATAPGLYDRFPPSFAQPPQAAIPGAQRLPPQPPAVPTPNGAFATPPIPTSQPIPASAFEGYAGYGFPSAPAPAPAAAPYGLGAAPAPAPAPVPAPAPAPAPAPTQAPPQASTHQEYMYTGLDARNLSNFYSGAYDPSALNLRGEDKPAQAPEQGAPAQAPVPAGGQTAPPTQPPAQPQQFPGMMPYFYQPYYMPNQYQYGQPGYLPMYGQGQPQVGKYAPTGQEGYYPPGDFAAGRPSEYNKLYQPGLLKPTPAQAQGKSSPALANAGLDYRFENKPAALEGTPRSTPASARPPTGQNFYPYGYNQTGYGTYPSYNYPQAGARGWRQG